MAEIEGTVAAFTALLTQKNIHETLDVSKSTVSGYRALLKEGKNLTLDKMEEMLLKAGATVAQEKVWIINGLEMQKIKRNNFPKPVLDRKLEVNQQETTVRDFLNENFFKRRVTVLSGNEVRSIIDLELNQNIIIGNFTIRRIS